MTRVISQDAGRGNRAIRQVAERTIMNPSFHNSVFRYIGRRSGKRFYFGSLADGKLTLHQLDLLESRFSCGLLVPESVPDPVRFSNLFAALVGRGCRGISFFGESAADLELVFDLVVLGTLIGDAKDDAVIWSTAHSNLIDTLVVLGAMTLPGANARRSDAVYLLQIGAETLRDECKTAFQAM
jgi:hypothetical protein